jgi:murein DD-endopeptidase MepM/ murein hydrolase activator NlpD
MTGSGRHVPVGSLLVALMVALVPNLYTPLRGAGHGPVRAAPPSSLQRSTPAVLHLRAAALPPAEVLKSGSRTHTVVAGDTLWDIARAEGVTVDALADANRISEHSVLHLGQVLAIPVPGSAGREAAASSRAAASKTHTVAPGTHTVAPGDTLWEIARGAGVSVEALASANTLSTDAILHPGQVLRMPPPGTPVRRLAAPASARHTSSHVPASSGAPTVVERLRMAWPSSGTITSRFGWRIHPIFGTREFHTGLDIATRWGSPVMAARTGIVRFAGWMAGYGELIVLDHGTGLQTLYSHLSSVIVRAGQHVDQGQVIGRIGNTGWSTGPHLFFEVRQNGVPRDPSPYLR